MNWVVRPGPITGAVRVPGDKSIAHRAVMVSTLAATRSRIRGLPSGRAVCSTIDCMRGLGAGLEWDEGRSVCVIDPPAHLCQPTRTLDAGNSGTTARLISGILAGQPFATTIDGDAWLRKRPMQRVIDPLSRMGARFDTADGRLPMTISGGHLSGIDYPLLVASAQVKSAILLAALFAAGETTITEPLPTRDHTERMLSGCGIAVDQVGDRVRIEPGRPQALDAVIPGDFSSAAFFLTAAALQGHEVRVESVGLNPTRTGFIDVLRRMGAQVRVEGEHEEGGEPIGDVVVDGAVGNPISVEACDIPRLIDELPLVALLATQAPGVSSIRGASELRVKETDRIATVTSALRTLGAEVEELDDGFEVRGETALVGATVESFGDHRVAMMAAVAGSIARGPTIVRDAQAADVSYPEFLPAFTSLGGQIDVC